MHAVYSKRCRCIDTVETEILRTAYITVYSAYRICASNENVSFLASNFYIEMRERNYDLLYVYSIVSMCGLSLECVCDKTLRSLRRRIRMWLCDIDLQIQIIELAKVVIWFLDKKNQFASLCMQKGNTENKHPFNSLVVGENKKNFCELRSHKHYAG